MGELRGERRRATDANLGTLDAIGLALAGIGVVAVWAVQLFAVPAFTEMFRDFGGELPPLTLAVIGPQLAMVCTFVALVCAGAGIAARLAHPTRAGTVLIALAAGAPMITVALMVYALYLPIFEIAGAIRA